jgi:hypothetical protein
MLVAYLIVDHKISNDQIIKTHSTQIQEISSKTIYFIEQLNQSKLEFWIFA